MKKSIITLLALILTAAVLLSFAACSGKADKDSETTTAAAPTPVSTQASDEGEVDGQNPVMNFVGDYAIDRCTITVEADGKDGAKFTVIWSNSAFEANVYTMSGSFDEDTLRVSYTNCEKKVVTYNEDGSVASEKVEYTDGVGRILFYDDPLSLQWQEENEAERLVGNNIFTYVS